MSTFERKGTVLEFTGNKGMLKMLDTNIAGDKRIMIKMVNDNQEEIDALLSDALSKEFRGGRLTLGNIMKLSYGKNELGRFYITREEGTWKEFSVESMTVVEKQFTTVNWDEIIAL